MADEVCFQYTYLPLDTIRLLQFEPESTQSDIRCQLVERIQYTKTKLKFTCLSYCWGESTSSKKILINRRVFYVTENLHQALQALFNHDRTARYWIDAICINQAKIEERNEQVGQMWRIFATAESVISWLGPSDKLSDKAFDALDDIEQIGQETGCQGLRERLIEKQNRVYSGIRWPLLRDNKDFQLAEMYLVLWDMDGYGRIFHYGGLRDFGPRIAAMAELMFSLLSREYFKRTWVIAEVMQARQILLMCGTHREGKWTTLQEIMQEAAGYVHPRQAVQAKRLFDARNTHLAADPIAAETFDEVFASVFHEFSSSHCQDARDRIFAMLGDPRIREMENQLMLRPDYHMSLEELATAVLEQYHLLEHRSSDDTVTASGGRHDVCAKLIRKALGVDVRSPEYGEWLLEQIEGFDVDERKQVVLMLKSGTKVHCDGPVLKHVLEDQEPKSRALQFLIRQQTGERKDVLSAQQPEMGERRGSA